MVLKTAARGFRLAAATAAFAVIAAACGGSDDGGGGEEGGAAAGSASKIQIQSIDGMGEVLTNSDGLTMYTSDLEEDGTVVCTSEDCLGIWHPVTLPEGETEAPAAPEGVTATIDVLERPSGEMQLTLNGAPLYTFDFDQPGKATGHEVGDTFNGNTYVWFVATPTGEAPAGAPSTTPSDDGYVYY